MPRERCSLVTNALHQIAIAANGVGMVIDQLREIMSEFFFRDRHSDAGRKTLP